MECANCYINFSPQWRNGYCNACGLYYKKFGIHKNVSKIYAKVLINIKNNKGY